MVALPGEDAAGSLGPARRSAGCGPGRPGQREAAAGTGRVGRGGGEAGRGRAGEAGPGGPGLPSAISGSCRLHGENAGVWGPLLGPVAWIKLKEVVAGPLFGVVCDLTVTLPFCCSVHFQCIIT